MDGGNGNSNNHSYSYSYNYNYNYKRNEDNDDTDQQARRRGWVPDLVEISAGSNSLTPCKVFTRISILEFFLTTLAGNPFWCASSSM
ncbi:GL23328 [Drosophila persimilis]|uniref:GL23328 n=1 Tax=Drosophila persimilis TaxID=7234 RepID=B4G4Q5_DROPE|nr:GL23328 [Drosophila persimilis]